MKYKLINKTSGEEHICEKVVVDGWDYYVSDDKIDSDNLWVISKRNNCLGKTFYPKNDGTVSDETIKELLLSVNYKGHYETTVGGGHDCNLIIATNNPSIDIPKVVDEVEIAREFATKPINSLSSNGTITCSLSLNGFEQGYNKSQETHSNSDGDMAEFAEWVDNMGYRQVANGFFKCLTDKKGKTTKELLQLWKEQRPKTLYYE